MPDQNYIHTLFSLENRVILITGGYGLLGEQFAETLAKAGATVVIGGRDMEKAQAVAKRVGGYAVRLDVSRKESVAKSVGKIVNKYGMINGLINNASYSSPAGFENDNFLPFEELGEAAWDKSLNVDVKGLFYCAQLAGKVMAENNGGVIVNVSSIYGSCSPDPRIYKSIVNSKGDIFTKPAGYCVAKGAVLNFTKYLAVYWREKNIRVNSLTLGGVYDNQDKRFVEGYSDRTPLSRMANKDEYNGAILYMLSDASSYMTGSNLTIDGGWTAW